MRQIKDELELEVSFWRKMVSEWNLRKDCSEYRRLLQALSLAEYKLSCYTENDDSGEIRH